MSTEQSEPDSVATAFSVDLSDERNEESGVDRKRKSVDISVTVGDYKCPVCLMTLAPPIVQCRDGHLFCSVCIDKCSEQKVGNSFTCAVCRVKGPSARARFAEAIVEGLGEKSPNDGCKRLRVKEGKAHPHTSCFYSTENAISCPFEPDCDWKGENLEGHLSAEHYETSEVPLPEAQQGKDVRIVLGDGDTPAGRLVHLRRLANWFLAVDYIKDYTGRGVTEVTFYVMCKDNKTGLSEAGLEIKWRIQTAAGDALLRRGTVTLPCHGSMTLPLQATVNDKIFFQLAVVAKQFGDEVLEALPLAT